MHHSKLYSIFFSFLFILNLGVSQNYNTSFLSKEILKEADIIIRNSTEVHDLSSKNENISTYSYAYTITKPKSSQLGDVAIYFIKNISKVKNLEIKYYDQRGNLIKKIKKKDLSDSNPYSDISMVDDIRYIRYSNSYNKYPYTVEVSYVRENKYAASVPSFSPYPYGTKYKTHVEKSNFSIVGSDETLVHKSKNLEDFKDYITYDQYLLNIEVKNLPYFKASSYSPPDNHFLPSIHYSRSEAKFNTTEVDFNDWESYGKWMYEVYLKDKYELSEETKSDVKNLITDLDSDYEIANTIYSHVVDNTRYVSIQLGEGGLEPFFAEDVHKKKYGDCKALSMYTLALLKEAGVSAFYTVIEANTEATDDFEKDFASIAQGNHIIIGVETEQDTIYADCTSSNVPFGKISSFTDGRWAVGINEKGGKLIKTDKYQDEENIQTIKSTIDINPSSKILNIGIRSTIDGNELSSRIAYNKYSDLNKKQSIYPFLYPQFSKETFQNVQMEYKEEIFIEEFSIETKKFLSSAGNYLIIPLQVHSLDLDKIQEIERKTPIYFKDGSVKKYTTLISIPDGYEWTGGIEKQKVESQFGSFEIQDIVQKNGTIFISIQVKRKSGFFPNDSVDEFNEWITAINKLENTKVIFRPLK